MEAIYMNMYAWTDRPFMDWFFWGRSWSLIYNDLSFRFLLTGIRVGGVSGTVSVIVATFRTLVKKMEKNKNKQTKSKHAISKISKKKKIEILLMSIKKLGAELTDLAVEIDLASLRSPS